MVESAPFIPFRFHVELYSSAGSPAPGDALICSGAFSEVSGLEATMTPKKIVEGGRNWGEVQRSGPVSFGTIVLRRGVTSVRDLWTWFEATTRKGAYGYRMSCRIHVSHHSGDDGTLITWKLSNVLPVKFKAPDLSATASAAAIEELHLVHEGLALESAVSAPAPESIGGVP